MKINISCRENNSIMVVPFTDATVVNPSFLPHLKIEKRLNVLPLQILQHHLRPVPIHRKGVRYHCSGG